MKISQVFLFFLFVCAFVCIEIQERKIYKNQIIDQNQRKVQIQKNRYFKKSQIIEQDAQEISHQQEPDSAHNSMPMKPNGELRTSEKKSTILTKKQRLLEGDDNMMDGNSQKNNDDFNDGGDHLNDNDGDANNDGVPDNDGDEPSDNNGGADNDDVPDNTQENTDDNINDDLSNDDGQNGGADDNHDANDGNQHQQNHDGTPDDNGHNDDNHSPNQNSNCAPGRCQTCSNNMCTQCKLDSKGQQKYLLIQGRCYESDTKDNGRDEVDSGDKWENHQQYHQEGHASFGGKKYKCQAGCRICDTTADLTKCTKCMDGFSLNTATSKCLRCDDKCVTCSEDSLQNCTSCYPGWTLEETATLGEFTCTKCATDHCGQCSTVDTCTNCKNFYYLMVGEQNTCQSCMENCRICSSSTSCSQCFSGYFLTEVDAVQSCVLCATGCASCQSLTDCKKCYPGHFMNLNTQTCDKCSSNCWECKSSTVCSRCISGYELLNNVCVSYIEDCAVMNPDNTCEQCFEGYLPNTAKTQCVETEDHDDNVCGENQYLQNKVCVNCGVTVQNCEKCNQQTCLKCKPEFFRQDDGLTCILCRNVMAGCKKCDNSIFCSRCADGYFMEQDRNGVTILSYGNCLKCDQNCMTCNERAIYCTSCVKDYSLTTARTCVPSNQFQFSLLLNIDLNQFPSKISQVKAQLAKLIEDSSISEAEKEKFVEITKISSGSVRITGKISAPSQSALQNTQQNFDKALSSGSTFVGIGVLSSDSKVSDNDGQQSNENDNETDEDSSSSSKGGMIAGIICGVIAGVVIIAGIVYFCICKKPAQTAEDGHIDEKKSGTTVDDMITPEMIQQNYESNHNMNTNNPQAVGPQYFV